MATCLEKPSMHKQMIANTSYVSQGHEWRLYFWNIPRLQIKSELYRKDYSWNVFLNTEEYTLFFYHISSFIPRKKKRSQSADFDNRIVHYSFTKCF